MATPAPSVGFLASTQAQHWLWPCADQLRAVRSRAQAKPTTRIRHTQRANEAAAAAAAAAAPAAAPLSPVAQAAAAADSAQPMQLASPVAPAAAAAKIKKAAAAAGPLEPLSMEEERLLRLHYTIQLVSMSSILDLPSFVSHTAIIYFKRFFLRESVMEYSPKDVAYCCIYLACKTEEYSLPVDRMVARIFAAAAAPAAAASSSSSAAPPAPALNPAVAATVSTVLSLEVPVLSTLQFHLRLHHLARALRGLIKELETFDAITMSRALWINPAEPIQTQYTNAAGPGTIYLSLAGFFSQTAAASRASVLLSHALLEDDLIFLYSPSQIALAVLATMEHEARSFAVEPKLDSTAHAASTPLASLNLVSRYIDFLKAPRPGAAGATAPSNKQLQAKVNEIRQLMEAARVQSMSIDKKLLKSIEKKRKAVSNPLLDPASKSYDKTLQTQEDALYHESKERASLEKDAKRAAKKKKQRDEEQRKQDDLLGMPSSSSAAVGVALAASPDRAAKDPMLASDSGGSGGFIISRKKLKSEPSTPAPAGGGGFGGAQRAVDGEGDLAMLSSPLAPASASASRIARKGSNLAAQFSEVGMEQE